MGTSKFNDQVKVAELLTTANLSLKLIHLKAGTKVPQHAKNAGEMVHICYGQDAKIGPIEEWLKEVSQPFYEFLPTAPQVMQVGGVQFLRKPISFTKVFNLSIFTGKCQSAKK